MIPATALGPVGALLVTCAYAKRELDDLLLRIPLPNAYATAEFQEALTAILTFVPSEAHVRATVAAAAAAAAEPGNIKYLNKYLFVACCFVWGVCHLHVRLWLWVMGGSCQAGRGGINTRRVNVCNCVRSSPPYRRCYRGSAPGARAGVVSCCHRSPCVRDRVIFMFVKTCSSMSVMLFF